MSIESSTISTKEKLFLFIWSMFLISTLFYVGYSSVTTIQAYKSANLARMADRIDPKAVGVDDIKALPPDAKPQKVTVGLYIDGISAISILESYWSPNFYIWFKWHGNNDLNPGESFTIVGGEINSKQKLYETLTNDEHYAIYFVRTKITKFFTTDLFPLDAHMLNIHIEDTSLMWQNLEYLPDVENTNYSKRVKIPGYKVTKQDFIAKPHTYRSNFGKPGMKSGERTVYSQLVYGLSNTRIGLEPYFKVFIGLFSAISIALLALLIKPTNVDPRFGLGVGGFFGAVTNTLLGSSMVTDSGIMTLMDMVNGIGMLTIFLTLVHSVYSLYLYDIKGKVKLSRIYDSISFVIFTLAYVVTNILLVHVAY